MPESFAAGFNDDEEAESTWLAGLPALTESCLANWDLTVDGPLLHGQAALVVPVRRGAESLVLKVSWPHDEAEHEALALSIWDGDGAVRLFANDPAAWALLLERLDPHTSLRDVPIADALSVVTSMTRRLDRPAPAGIRHMRDNAARWVHEFPVENNNGLVPAELVDQAVAYCRELAERTGDHLVNEDLHYDNVLRAEREPWLVIDPKPIAGDLEYGLIPLLWNRLDDVMAAGGLPAIVDATGMDLALARRWTFVRAVDNWLYGGPGHWLGAACARITAAVA